MRRTKIVCTIGPASDNEDVLRSMIDSGMDVARLNFSHGSYEEHLQRIGLIRKIAADKNKYIGIMLDTKGPEIRTGIRKDGQLQLVNGELVDMVVGTESSGKIITIDYPYLLEDIHSGKTILIDDGKINLQVESVEREKVVCRVIVGGLLKDKKGVNVPGVSVRLPAMTSKDREDIIFGIENEVDFIAASFIRNANEVLQIRKILEEKKSSIQIISKIEHSDAVSNIDAIIAVSDGVMVARGDLGVELPTEEVPLVQKVIIEKCNQAGKPVITATQMLDSMIVNPRPTRAEASDVANSIYDGTDATMLSGESAAGHYPVESVQMMARIAAYSDANNEMGRRLRKKKIDTMITVADAISHASCETAEILSAAAVITPTESGSTARMVAKYRPSMPVIAVTPNSSVCRQLTLVWGVVPLLIDKCSDTDIMFNLSVQSALRAGLIEQGDMVVLTAGVPFGVTGTTNLVKVHIASAVLCHGSGIVRKSASGSARIVNTIHDAEKLSAGDVAVFYSYDVEYAPFLRKAEAWVVVEGGLTSDAAIAAMVWQKPVIVGAEDAMTAITDGSIITVDGIRGLVYKGFAHVL